jgi:hypothetical protein
MRFALVLPIVLAALAGTAVRPQPAVAQCVLVVVWHDTAYFGYYRAARPLPAARAPVRGAVEPGCNDTGGDPGPPTPVGARAIAGGRPEVALMWDRAILVPAGVFPQLRGFPVAPLRVDDETRTCSGTTPVTLTGYATPGLGAIHLAVRGGVDVRVDAHTRIEGLVRNGLPYIGQGQPVHVAAVRCGHTIVARRIVPAGRIVAPATAEDVLGPHWRGGPGLVARAMSARWLGVAALTVAVAVVAALWIRRRSGAVGAG